MFANKIARVLYVLSFAFFLLFIFLSLENLHTPAGLLLMISFISLAFAFRFHHFLKSLSFTVFIFSAVIMALYFPKYFLSWGQFKLTELIIPLIQLIMFGMGTSMSARDFAAVFRSPRAVMIGVVSQFIIMPVIGFSLAMASHLPPEIAAGIVLVGCSPSGIASNVMSYLAKANLALSITLTSITTLLAPLLTPLLMKLLAGTLVQIDVLKMTWDIIKMIIIPIGAGLIFNRLLSGRSRWVDKAMPVISMVGIAAILVVITAAGRDNLLAIGPALILIVLIHNFCGYFLGYWVGRLFRMPETDCRTIAIEVGMQNSGLASGLAKEMGRIATVGLAPAVFGPLMNISGSSLAGWWHSRPPAEKQKANPGTTKAG